MRQTTRRRWVWVVLILLVLAASAYIARRLLLVQIANALVDADSPARADAIVVLAGGAPLREIEAADLYLAGYSPRIILTFESDSSAPALLRARGVPYESAIDLRRRILHGLGVPDSAVTVLDREVAISTRVEALLIRDWVAATGARRIIIVTSRFHTARASLIFRRTLREHKVEILMRPATHDPFDPSRWWHDRAQLRDGIFEWQKLLFYYLAYR
jgi:uncharacterized SAM-binding protein YcdF (DUF218 family)